MKNKKPIKKIGSLLLFLFIFGSILLFSLSAGNNISGGILEDEIIDDSDKFSRDLKNSALEFGMTEVVSTESISTSGYPTIVVDSAGSVHIAWNDYTNYDNSGVDQDIFYKRWDVVSSMWTTTEVVSTESTLDSRSPTIAVDDIGNVHIAWYDYTNYANSGTDMDIFYKRWDVASSMWTTTEVVSTESTLDSQYPTITVDGVGNVHMAWEDSTNYGNSGTDGDIFYKRWDVVSSTWTATEVVSTESTLDSGFSTIAVEGVGYVHVAWRDLTNYDNSGADWDVFYKRWDVVSSTWTTTEVVSTESTDNSFTPTIVVDYTGNVHMAWRDLTNYDNSGTDEDIFYKRRDAASSTWTTTEVVSTESTGNSYPPAIIVDGAENVHVVWYDFTNYANSGPDLDIFYKRWDAVSSTWTATEVVSTESTSYSRYPTITVDYAGNVHITWEDLTDYDNSGSDMDIFYKRLSVPEISTNPFTVIEVTNTPDVIETTPMLGADDVSRIVVYTSQSFDPLNGVWEPGIIYAQRLDGVNIIPPLISVAAGSTDNQLNDISGNLVVYTAFTDAASSQGQIHLIDLNDVATPHIISNPGMVREARICGDLVAWIEFYSGISRVILRNVSSMASPIVISTEDTQPARSLQIGDTFVVWEVGYDIVAYDLRTSQLIWVANNSTLRERYPSTSGTWVTWEEQVSGTVSRICAVDVDSGDEPIVVIDDGGYNHGPTIDGDIIAYEALVYYGLNDLNYDIFAYRISTGETLAVTTRAGDQKLNCVFGNQVAYVDNGASTNDISVTTFWFDPSNLPPEMLWIRQFGTDGIDEAWVTSVDSTGVYVAGHTNGALPLQSNVGFEDAFVCKYDHNGNQLWIQQFGTTANDFILGSSIDSTGLYLTGILGSLGFVRKYNPYDGNTIWTQYFPPVAFEISVDFSGVYVVGSTIIEGNEDVFVRKFDHNGNELWNLQFGTLLNNADRGRAISVESTGVYIAGFTEGALPGQINEGGTDNFVRKYDIDTGSEIWTRQFGTPELERPIDVETDSTGVYIVGHTEGTLPGQTNAGDDDAYIRKYDHNGNEVWTHQFGTSEYDRISEVFTFASEVYVAGQTYGSLPSQTSAGSVDGFVRKYDQSGNEIWTHQFGTEAAEEAFGVAVDSTGAYVTGYTSGTLPGQTSSGGRDAFVAKLAFKNTPTGVGIKIIASPEVSLTFSEVTDVGYTQVIVNTENPGSEMPGFQFLGNYYDITTSATYTGAVTVSIAYDGTGMTFEEENALQLLHWNGTTWVDATTNIDTINNIIYGNVSSFSWFGIAHYSPLLPFVIDDDVSNGAGDYTWAEAVLESWCSGAGIGSNPYVIENLAINGGGGSGIMIRDSTAHFTIRNCTIFNSSAGIVLSTVNNGNITDNNCSNNGIGISLYSCESNRITGNIANNNTYEGIRLSYWCYRNTITGNTANNNSQYGINLHFLNTENTITGNTANNNLIGICLNEDGYLNAIINNTVNENSIGILVGGFYYTGCIYNNIAGNLISNNDDYGIYLAEWNAPYEHKNSFSRNIFLDNGVNAWDDGIINHWGNNYWDDYPGVDVNDDGIGDTPYFIPGYAGSQDNNPIWDDGDTPVSFVIDDDVSNGGGDYTWAEAALEPWCSGSGTELDPYVIENLIIDANGGNCITIRDSNVYFVIKNCMIFNSSTGIYLLNVQNGNIIENEIDISQNGIHLEGSSQNTILNNTIKSFMPEFWTYGIYLEGSSNNNISRNDITNGWDGLCLEYSSSNIISDNTVRESYYGFMVDSSFQNELINNSIIDAQAGFLVTESWSNTLSNNTALRNGFGFLLLGSFANTLTGNIANENVRGIQLDLFSQDNNITQNIASNNEKYGICLTASCNNNTITGNTVNNNLRSGIYLFSYCNDNDIIGNIADNNGHPGGGHGIYLEEYCDFNTISENTVPYNFDYGIYLISHCNNNTIVGNTAYNNHDGIYLQDYCDYNNITGNTANGNAVGISLNYNCNNNTITGNTVNNNLGSGIYLFSYCNDNDIIGNTAWNNGWYGDRHGYGIYLEYYCDFNTISGNTVNDNNDYGIFLYNCDYNTITGNTANRMDYGIFLNNYCDGNDIIGNTVNNNLWHGIYLFSYCNDNNIIGNTVYNNGHSGGGNGIYLEEYCDFNTISGNIVNSNHAGIYLISHCNNNTIVENNADSNHYGIYLTTSCNDNKIMGNDAYGNYDGIYLLDYCDNNTITGNTARDNINSGIFLHRYCNGNDIIGNTACSNDFQGIMLDYYCNGNNIIGNTANSNNFGIRLGLYCDNNTITGNIANNNFDSGIYLTSYCNDNTITGNTASNIGTSNQYIGIYLEEDCDFNNISGNIVNNNLECGIYLEDYCNDNDITGNTVNNNFNYGIYLINQCYGNYIRRNNASNIGTSNQDSGIYLEEMCDFNTISGNTVSNNEFYGIYLSTDCNYNNINGNSATNNDYGIYLQIRCNDNTITENTVNNNYDYGIRLRSGCDYNTITGNYISDNYYGISLYYKCSYNTISENTVNDNRDHGIFLVNNCIGNAIMGNTVNNNNYYGIYLSTNCDYNTINGNTANNNEQGIYLSGACDNNTITENTADNNYDYGISLTFNCDDNTITGNNASNIGTSNQDNGIYLEEMCDFNNISGNIVNNNNYYGIILDYGCDNNTLSGNTATNNDYGIHLEYYCEFNTISGNTVSNNNYYGIYLDSSDNIIYSNNMTNNLANALDSGINNQWDNGSLGNYWDDYPGMDLNDDGIGDSPYLISGSAGSQDNYPIWDDGPDFDSDGDSLFDRIEELLGTNPLVPDTDGDGLTDGDEVLNLYSDPLNYMDPVNLPFIIDGETTGVGAHNWTWAVTYKVCTGSGTYSDPYVIEGFEINAGGSVSGIEIRNSDVYFIIKNCKVYNAGSVGHEAGIKLEHVNNGLLINNIASNNERCGIYLNDVSNNTISGNTANNNFGDTYLGYGIWFYSNCYNNVISGNTLINNTRYGIYLMYGGNNIISGNMLYTNNIGIGLWRSSNNTILGNIVNNTVWFGIYLMYSGNNTISENTVNNTAKNGIYLWTSSNNTISGNIVNNNIQNGIYLWTSSNNTILGNTVNNNNNNGIYLDYSNNNTIFDNIAQYNNIGICLNYSDSNTVTDNTASDNYNYGIFLENHCNDNIIEGNTANENIIGIYLNRYCNNNDITSNTANNNYNSGIYLVLSCNDNYIVGNTASNIGTSNQDNGIYLEEDCDFNYISGSIANSNNDYGIYLISHCDYNDITGNTANENSIGIYLTYYCNNNTITDTITGNDANNNNDYGIYLEDHCDNNTITGNTANENHYGIYLASFCNYNYIMGNDASNIGTPKQNIGIYLENYCYFNILSGNTVNENAFGIRLSDYCNENTITGNTVNNNHFYGISLYSDCDDNDITGNTVNDNNYGIYLADHSSSNLITGNTANENAYGIKLMAYSNNNLIYHNNFINNYNAQAYESGANNHWYYFDLMEGNYWSDYIGQDDGSGIGKHAIAGDGIGDNNIPWYSDYYPFIDIDGWLLIDSDNDGLLDLYEETVFGTDPLLPDTDGDGLLDGAEINNYGTDPNNWDSDGDGLSDGEEVNTYGTDPLIPDTDGDGLTDGDEVLNLYSDPLNYMDPVNLPIFIDGDATGVGAHNWTWALNFKICTGLGTYSDPYVVEDFVISNPSGYGILVMHSTAYFVIRNCTIFNSDLGIVLSYVENGKLIDNNCSNNDNGIALSFSSNNNTITGNTASNNTNYGIMLNYMCNDNTITGNVVNENLYGIYLLQYCEDNTIAENIATNNSYGIYIFYHCNDNTITGNILNGNTERCIFETDDSINIIIMNLCNGVYDGVSIDDNGYDPQSIPWAQAATYDWCSGSGTLNDPYVLEDFVISNPSGYGILVMHSTAYFVIRNCTIFNSDLGIVLSYVENGKLIDNNCSNNDNGIALSFSSNNNTITGNTASNNTNYGIMLNYMCNDNTITGNVVNENLYGIYLLQYCEDNTIAENIATNNTYGIYIFYHCNDNTITGNILNGNTERCIFETDDSINIIFMNLCNGVYDGVSIDDNGGYPQSIPWAQAATYDWCSGSGTLSDPYVLEDFVISNPSGYGILVMHSTAYFVIRNCTIFNSDLGIVLSYVENGKLIDNNCSNNDNGIALSFSSNNNTITGNTASNNTNYGIMLNYMCNDNTITGNVVSENLYGIYLLQYCEDNNITENIATNNTYGIYAFYHCNNNTITENTANENDYGISLEYHCNDNNITGNTASNIDILSQISGIVLENYCDFNTITGNNVTNNYGDGIYLEIFCDFNTITGNTASNNDYSGIYLNSGCNNNTITGNTASNNDYYGIYLNSGCNNNTITGNTANNNTYDGIYLYQCDNNTISGNTANNNSQHGIYLYVLCTDNTITNNTANNNLNGIYLNEDCYFNVITNNTVNENNKGIIIQGYYWTGCIYNTIAENIISNNDDYGIYLAEWNAPYEHKNSFSGNIFLDNGVNAWDDGIDNQWDNGSFGNYWDDYPGVDLNDDGIGDTPYIIPGSAVSQDNYPIWDDGDTPVSFIIDNNINNGGGDYTWAEAALEPWCSGSGTELYPYVIENLIIDANGGNCITIRDSNVYFVIKNCMIFNSSTGIYLLNVQNGNIIKNEIDNTQNGIHLEGSSQNTILNNTVKSFMPSFWTYGIYLKDSSNNNLSSNDITNGWRGLYLQESSNNTISDNIARESYYGFSLWKSSQNDLFDNSIVDAQVGFNLVESWNNTLSTNIALRNGFGFLLIGSSANKLTGNIANENVRGIQLNLFSQDNNITRNIANNNGKYGICLADSCNNNTITGNTVNSNEIYGIYLEYNCNLNIIYLNNFTDNVENAFDEGTNNQWDNRTIGNYWDDYQGLDLNDDGIGDAPYFIPGSAGSQDNYPIWEDEYTLLSLVVDDDISNGEGDYTWAEAALEPWCSGSGSELYPYIIEYLIMDGCGGTSITIRDSTAYFEIRNCKTFNSSTGIMLVDVDNGKLIDNNCSNNDYGIKLSNSNNNTVSGNTANNNIECGIYLEDHCNDNTISGNTANNNHGAGISLSQCDNNTISGNTAGNNLTANQDRGIYLYYSDNNTISGNTANNNRDYGIYLTKYCFANKIIGNTANNNNYGIYLYEWCDDNTISGNTANNNDFGIYLITSCDRNNITGNTANNNIYFGIYLSISCHDNTLSGNTANDNHASGIYLSRWCHDNTISGNTANNNHGAGIILSQCDNNTISGNTAGNNLTANQDRGLYFIYCVNNIISGNTANDNQYYGIYLTYCDNNTISGNTASNNTYFGIYLYDSDNNTISGNTANNNEQYGIHLNHICYENTITGNTANNNTYYGIYLYEWCDDNTISGNTANNNTYYGIYLAYHCNSNTITGNTANSNNYGIYLSKYCLANEIIGNTANDNHASGISLRTRCHDNTLSGNTANNNHYYGIYLDLCYDNTISGNTASNNLTANQVRGIYLFYCVNNIISGNTANNNTYFGIYLYYSDNNTISGNIANNNRDNGIYLYNCDDNTITGNAANNNLYYGIHLINCDSNTISGNKIFDNIILNGFDDGINFWNNTVIGNYWGDYIGVDADHDGMGDTPYDIPGGINRDYKPIFDYTPDPNGDTDGDGLTNAEEIILGTSPNLLDSDGDGISDGNEILLYNTDPLANVDTYTPAEPNVQITDQNYFINLTFDEVTEAGATTIEGSETGPISPEGFQLGDIYYSITTTAEYEGTIHLEIPYDESVVGDENFLTLLHYNETSGEWEDITVFIDMDNNIIYGEVESLSIFGLFIDTAPPSITVETPGENQALQDGIVFTGKAEDLSGVIWVNLTIREDDGANGIFIHDDFENMSAVYDEITKQWQLFFNTTDLPDGYYLLIVESSDRFGLIGVKITSVSIRNWAVLELLPATEENNAGRTMPVKFSLRVAEAVDINTPFVLNEELHIVIYAFDNPEDILQLAIFGDGSTNYRIDSIGELYITNFKTLKKPEVYVVEIWRKSFFVGNFTFETVDKNAKLQDSGDLTDDSKTDSLEIVQNFNKLYLYTYFPFGLFVFLWVIAEMLKIKTFKM